MGNSIVNYIPIIIASVGVIISALERYRSFGLNYETKINTLREAKGQSLKKSFDQFLNKADEEAKSKNTALFDQIILNYMDELKILYDSLKQWYEYKFAIPKIKRKIRFLYKISIISWFVTIILFGLFQLLNPYEIWSTSIVHAFLSVLSISIYTLSSFIPVLIVIYVYNEMQKTEEEWDNEIYKTAKAPKSIL